MAACYIGRGELFARKLDVIGSGFTRINGESEVTVAFSEDVGYVEDARYGRLERTDRFSTKMAAELTCDVFDQSASNLALLLKGTEAVVSSGSGIVHTIPVPTQLNALYPLPRRKVLPGYLVKDAGGLGATLVEGVHYRLDADLGLFELLTPSTPPYQITYSNASYAELGLATQNSVSLELMFKGVNRRSRAKILAVFYRAELRIGTAMRLISRDFASIPFAVDLVADFTHHVDDVLSHYGKVTIL